MVSKRCFESDELGFASSSPPRNSFEAHVELEHFFEQFRGHVFGAVFCDERSPPASGHRARGLSIFEGPIRIVRRAVISSDCCFSSALLRANISGCHLRLDA